MGIHNHKFEKGAIAPEPVGVDKGMDARVPCPLDTRPTEEDAQENYTEANSQHWNAHRTGVNPKKSSASSSVLSTCQAIGGVRAHVLSHSTLIRLPA